jgi:hypothetical protein
MRLHKKAIPPTTLDVACLTLRLTERYADLDLRAVVTLAMAAATIVCVVKGYLVRGPFDKPPR